MRRTLTDSLRIRQTQLTKEIGFLENRIRTAPEGKLRISSKGKHPQYYLQLNNGALKERYLKQDEFPIAKALAQKKYDTDELENARKEKKHVDAYLSFMEVRPRVYDTLSEKRQALIEPYDSSDKEYAKQWLAIPYEKKGFAEGTHVYRTDRGELVRSKSEALIANLLFHAGVPYKYEKPYRMFDGLIIRPDFTVLNKRTREVFIWEHFGMMDDDSYRDSFFEKIKTYTENGYVPGLNLLISFEGSCSGHEFDTAYVKRIIKEFLS